MTQDNAASLVYLRDASWHVTVGLAGCYHFPHPNDEALAACSSRIALHDDLSCRAGSVPEHMRCRRNGCRQLWPTPDNPPCPACDRDGIDGSHEAALFYAYSGKLTSCDVCGGTGATPENPPSPAEDDHA